MILKSKGVYINKPFFIILFTFIIVTLSLNTLVGCTSNTDNEDRYVKLSIFQNFMTIKGDNEQYEIMDEPFNLVLDGLESIRNIKIFAYHTPEYFDLYKWPIAVTETPMFRSGSSLAINLQEPVSLQINGKHSVNNIVSEQWKVNDGQATILIDGFKDPFNKVNNKIFLTIFVDFNENEIIENNEIKNITINTALSELSVPTEKTYLFETKFHIAVTSSDVSMHENFLVFKLTNPQEGLELSNYMRKNTDFFKYRRRAHFVNWFYETENQYVLMSPMGAQLTIQRPYHYEGSSYLIFDITESEEYINDNHMLIMFFPIKKEDDIHDIKFNINGSLKSPHIESLPITY